VTRLVRIVPDHLNAGRGAKLTELDQLLDPVGYVIVAPAIAVDDIAGPEISILGKCSLVFFWPVEVATEYVRALKE